MSKAASIKVLSDSQLLKKYPKAGKASIVAVTPENALRLPCRIIALNYQLNGGIPYGKILEVFGEESTGKSLLALDFAYCCEQLGGEIIWADAENAFDGLWFQKNGLNLEKINLLPEETAIEIISDWCRDTILAVRSRLTKNEPILFVLDSLAALDCLENINSSQVDSKAEMGNRAKAIYKFLRTRNQFLAEHGACVILINQLRRKVGASKFEDPDTTPGGAACKFYASQRLGLIRGKQIKKKINGIEVKVGQNVFLRTKKDKTGPPRSTTPSQVYFIGTKSNPTGFNKYHSLHELLVQLGVIQRKKGASKYFYKDKMIANGEDDFYKTLRDNEELRKRVIKASGINTISRAQDKISSLSKNLFPIKTGKKQKDEDSDN